MKNELTMKLNELYESNPETWPSSLRIPSESQDSFRRRSSNHGTSRYFGLQFLSSIPETDLKNMDTLDLEELELLGEKQLKYNMECASANHVCIYCSKVGHIGLCEASRCFKCHETGHESRECKCKSEELNAKRQRLEKNLRDALITDYLKKNKITCMSCGEIGRGHVNCSDHPTTFMRRVKQPYYENNKRDRGREQDRDRYSNKFTRNRDFDEDRERDRRDRYENQRRRHSMGPDHRNHLKSGNVSQNWEKFKKNN